MLHEVSPHLLSEYEVEKNLLLALEVKRESFFHLNPGS